jgi:hypothetical protein
MIAGRLRAWFENRLPLSDTHVLTQRNIYILPTKAGFAFALTLVLMLVASINYQLNLGYLLTFLLAGSALVSMHLTHGTLRGLTLRVKPPSPVFLGQPAEVEVVLNSPGAARHGIGLSVRRKRPHFAWCDVPAQGSATARVTFAARQRGLTRLPTLMAETRFPLGLFRAWTILRPAATVLIYPQPEQPPVPLPPTQAVPGATRNARAAAGGEFDGVRSYRRGDAMRRVVWKKARTHRRTGEPRHQRKRQPGAVARLRRCGVGRCRGATVAAGGVDPGRGTHRARLRLAHSRRRVASCARRRPTPRRARGAGPLAIGRQRDIWPGSSSRCPAGPAGATCRARRATHCSCWR